MGSQARFLRYTLAEIDDNSYDEDHYRYHDILHLSFMANLGWSPVLRKLLDCKRKVNPDTDRIEDGARARDTEEAITRLIFAFAGRRNYYKNSNSVDTELLHMIRYLSSDLEVRVASQNQWQKAILDAFTIFHKIKEENEATVRVNKRTETLELLN